MSDIWSSEKRSEVMARIRKTDSRPELILREHLKLAKIPFSTYADLPGTPDVVIEDSRLAVFVHGCFWHGCPRHYRKPHSNVEYWSAKLQRNKERDRETARRIKAMGWHRAVIWECELNRDPQRVVILLKKELERIDEGSRAVL